MGACFEALCMGVLRKVSDLGCIFFRIQTSGFEQCERRNGRFVTHHHCYGTYIMQYYLPIFYEQKTTHTKGKNVMQNLLLISIAPLYTMIEVMIHSRNKAYKFSNSVLNTLHLIIKQALVQSRFSWPQMNASIGFACKD